MKLNRMAPVGLVVLALFCPTIATATVIQVEEDGFIISYPDVGFPTASGGAILGHVPAYGNDAGFFYNPVTDRYVQIEEDGFIISYTAAGFLTGSGVILGHVPAYGDDAGFFYDWNADRYVQIEEDGFVISYTAAGFLTGSGVILGQVPAYGNDAGFLFVAEYAPAQISLPSTLSLFLGGIGILAALGRRRRDSPDG